MVSKKSGKVFVVFTALLFFLPWALWSVDFFVDYAEGAVDVRRGSGWEEVYIGDVLTDRDTLRLTGYSIVELSYGSETATLSKPGTYALGGLSKDISRRESVGFSSLLSGKVQTALKGSRHMEQSAAGGVRGSEAVEKDQMSWMASDTLDLIEAGKEKFARGEIEAARGLFREALDYALDAAEEGKAAFYLAGCFDVQGSPGKALELLESADVGPAAEEYFDFLILKGKLLIESFAYPDAEDLLSGADLSTAPPETSQLVYFLLGIACLGQDKTGQARDYLTRSRNIDASSDTGTAAAEMLGTL